MTLLYLPLSLWGISAGQVNFSVNPVSFCLSRVPPSTYWATCARFPPADQNIFRHGTKTRKMELEDDTDRRLRDGVMWTLSRLEPLLIERCRRGSILPTGPGQGISPELRSKSGGLGPRLGPIDSSVILSHSISAGSAFGKHSTAPKPKPRKSYAPCSARVIPERTSSRLG
jgi:hypothetical protein